jgi:hypothetical protein
MSASADQRVRARFWGGIEMEVLARLLPVAVLAAMTSATGCIIGDLWKFWSGVNGRIEMV